MEDYTYKEITVYCVCPYCGHEEDQDLEVSIGRNDVAYQFTCSGCDKAQEKVVDADKLFDPIGFREKE
jgi:hypothetical protein